MYISQTLPCFKLNTTSLIAQDNPSLHLSYRIINRPHFILKNVPVWKTNYMVTQRTNHIISRSILKVQYNLIFCNFWYLLIHNFFGQFRLL